MILNFLWCLSPAVSCAVLNKGAGLSLPGLASPYRKHPLNWGPAATAAGLPSPYRKHPLNWGPAATAAGLPSPSSLARCHLSQSERPWQSAKFPGLYFTPCCRKGSRQALRSDFTPLPRAPPLGKTPSGRREMSHMRQREDSWREAPERASPLAGRLRPGLAGTCGGAKSHPSLPPIYSTTFSKKYQNPLDFRKLK